MQEKKTIAFATLGCRVNQWDTEMLKQMAKEQGYNLVPFFQKADIYIINTCLVTAQARHKSQRKINQARKKNPQAKIVVTGCWPQQEGRVKGADVVSGTKNRQEIFSFLAQGKKGEVKPFEKQEKFFDYSLTSFGGRARAFVKAQEGCNQFCSYCVIPFVRGPARSRPLPSILREVENFLQQGYREFVLTGTNLGVYGIETGKASLPFLLKKIFSLLPPTARVRLSSLSITAVNQSFLEIVSQEKRLCPHFHFSLQSGDEFILKLMKRPYTPAYFAQKIEQLRKFLPQAAFTTDVIVGFPQETEEMFENTYNFCQKIGFSRLHIFPFSARPGTAAFSLPKKIKQEIIKERAQKMRFLARQLEENYSRQFIGQRLAVVAQKINKGKVVGLAENYLTVCFSAPAVLQEKEIYLVKIKGKEKNYLKGNLIKKL